MLRWLLVAVALAVSCRAWAYPIPVAGVPVGGSVSTNTVAPSGASVSNTLAALWGRVTTLDDFVQSGDSGYSSAWSRAFANCSANGGGMVQLLPHQYLLSTGGTIPTSCVLYCPAPLLGNANPTNYNSAPYVVLEPSSAQITMATGSGWRGCGLLASGFSLNYATATIRNAVSAVAAFAGTGIQTASDVSIRDAWVGGFALGIYSFHGARDAFDHVNIDSTACMLSDQNHDISRYFGIHCFPFLTSGLPTASVSPSYSIASIADNGSGLYRLTMSAPTPIITGDTVFVSGYPSASMTGAQSISGRLVIVTAVDSTHMDIQGSSSSGITTNGSTTVNSAVVILGSLANIGIGSVVSGAGIPVGTSVLSVSPTLSAVVLTNKATATGAGIGLSFSDTTYTGSASVYLDASARAGVGLEFTNSETNYCSECFSFGHFTEFHVGTAMSWLGLIQPTCDANGPDNNMYSVCVLIDGTSTGTSILGGSSQSVGRSLVVNSTGNGPHVIQAMQMNTNNAGEVAEFASGSVTLIGNSSPAASREFVVGDNITILDRIGDNLGNKIAFQSIIGRSKYFALGNVQASNQYAGNLSYNGTVLLGGGGAACGDTIAACSITLAGQEVDSTTAATSVTNGASVSLSANGKTFVLHATGSLSSLTLALPSIQNVGQQADIYFDQAISTLTLPGSPVVVGMPSSIIANSWHLCRVATLTTNEWVCN